MLRIPRTWLTAAAARTLLATALILSPGALRADALPLSPGDRLRVFIPDEGFAANEENFSGVYEVNLDGRITFPYIGWIEVNGRAIEDVQQDLEQRLVEDGFFQPDFLRVTVAIYEWAPVQVTVRGEVFQPGRVLVNAERTGKASGQPEALTPISGDYPPERYLTAAIAAVNGVTPHANVSQVRLIRGDSTETLDLSGIFSGDPVTDVPLVAGDIIEVPSLGDQIDPRIVRPSAITRQTVDVYFSNLTRPASGGFNLEDRQFEYGSRFSNAATAARCAGGSEATNADRRIALIKTNRETGSTEVFERSVEDLLRQTQDTQTNPYLMPGDGVICYDSFVTEASGFLDFLSTILNPIEALDRLLFRRPSSN